MQSYFEMLGLPPTFALNQKNLEQAYFTAQGACHPDRFVGKSEAERMASITRSQQVNDAYETLKHPLRRAEHLLELQGIAALDDDAAPPSALLMEMMELRERLADAAQEGAALAAVLAEIKAEANASLKTLETLFAAQDFKAATAETMRLNYLGKAIEEAHMLIYRLKAGM